MTCEAHSRFELVSTLELSNLLEECDGMPSDWIHPVQLM